MGSRLNRPMRWPEGGTSFCGYKTSCWGRRRRLAFVGGGGEWKLSPAGLSLRSFRPSLPAMTTTTTYKGVDPNGRNSSRVLRPPGGGSNFNLSFDLPKEQPVRRNKMASNIFGLPEENPVSRDGSTGAMPRGVREDSEPSGPQRKNSSDANCGDFVDPKDGESGETFENIEADVEAAPGQSEEKTLPAAPVPSPVAPVPAPSRRNPPGGKSSLVLG
ncbi:jupiter microtubule associated homolog 1 [Chelonia mydas]|uniref:jupiter microtubule associated homolog 1 n=1 Tax=Chelonia mydas TaxID=8469 RepID=UPI0018A2324E|nr:jupiter microtubule associated homolog 1 [Chelonia mydas]